MLTSVRATTSDPRPALRVVRPAGPKVPAEPKVLVRIDLAVGAEPVDERVLDLMRQLAELAGGPRVVADRPAPAPVLPAGPAAQVRIYPESRAVWRGDEQVGLTRLEFDLLLFLAERPGCVFTRNQLLRQVWGSAYQAGRTVDVHVRRLRMKVTPPASQLVTTVRGIGYRLADSAAVKVVRTADPVAVG